MRFSIVSLSASKTAEAFSTKASTGWALLCKFRHNRRPRSKRPSQSRAWVVTAYEKKYIKLIIHQND